MAQKVRSGSVTRTFRTYPPFLERSGPHMPVTWDPESQPRGVTSKSVLLRTLWRAGGRPHGSLYK